MSLVDAQRALAGGERGPAIVPGSPEKSRLIQALTYKNVDLQMPPTAKLPAAVIDDFSTWIKNVAVWVGPGSSGGLKVESFDLARRKAEHWAWKEKVLNREIELEEIDTTPFRDRYGPNSVQVTPQAAE